jgi:uncharacterized cofD-like protein
VSDPIAGRPAAGDTLRPHVVAVGGGHGLAATLRAVVTYAGRTTAVVATADDGGSTGRLRSGLGMPAPGDLRRCVTALAPGPDDPLVRGLEYRFRGTDVEGHALGNLLLAGLLATTGDFVAAVDEMSRLAGLDPATRRVLPATTDPVVLRAETVDGRCVPGQVAVAGTPGIDRVAIAPADAAVPEAAAAAIEDADQIVLGPGSLFTSVLAAVAPAVVRDALKRATGPTVYVCNVRAEAGETRGYDVADHVAALRRHGVEPDFVLAQRGALPRGALDGVEVVDVDVVRPHGLAHDPALLALALAALLA